MHIKDVSFCLKKRLFLWRDFFFLLLNKIRNSVKKVAHISLLRCLKAKREKQEKSTLKDSKDNCYDEVIHAFVQKERRMNFIIYTHTHTRVYTAHTITTALDKADFRARVCQIEIITINRQLPRVIRSESD